MEGFFFFIFQLGFVRVAQVLIPFGLSLGCLAFLSAIIGFMSTRAFITTVLFSALFAFLSCKYRRHFLTYPKYSRIMYLSISSYI
jgi:hypothetical protein